MQFNKFLMGCVIVIIIIILLLFCAYCFVTKAYFCLIRAYYYATLHTSQV